MQQFFLLLTVSVMLTFSSISVDEKFQIDNAAQTNLSAIKINHTVKGRDVFVECIVPGFSFKDNVERIEGEGHIHVYLNGKKIKDVNRAAFILKDLPKGKHKITLKFVYNDNTPYRYSKSFPVHIH